MPRYRVTIWSRSNHTIRTQRTVVKRSIRDLIRDVRLQAEHTAIRMDLPASDIGWTIERYGGHMGPWIIAAHDTVTVPANHG